MLPDQNIGSYPIPSTTTAKYSAAPTYQNIEIDKVLIKSSEKLGNAQIKRINSELQRLNISFHKSARACYDPQWPGPWGHVLKYEKANVGKTTLSILFDIAEGCSGQPHFNTFAANFSIQTGKRISTKELLERYAPSLLKAGAEVSHDFLILGDDAFSILMEQNEGTFTPDLQESCDFFLRRTGFRVWVEENRLVLACSGCASCFVSGWEDARTHLTLIDEMGPNDMHGISTHRC